MTAGERKRTDRSPILEVVLGVAIGAALIALFLIVLGVGPARDDVLVLSYHDASRPLAADAVKTFVSFRWYERRDCWIPQDPPPFGTYVSVCVEGHGLSPEDDR